MKKNGISLIVLIITIIVVIILAAVVILTLSKNNPIESAKEARFKEDVRIFQDELALSVSKQYAEAGGHRDYKINTSDFEDIKEYIPSFSEKYKDKFVIEDDELCYTISLDEKEENYAQNLNIKMRMQLPHEFKKIEYIENTGTQYITTNYIANGNIEVFCKYQFTNNQYGDSMLFGYKNEGDAFYAELYDNNRWYCGCLGSLYSYIVFPGETYATKYRTQNTLVLNKNTFTATGEIYAQPNGNTLMNNPIEMYIFAWNAFGNVQYINKGVRIYYLKITNETGKNVVNFIPCYSTTTVTDVDGTERPAGTVGLYDTVEGKFYTNQGTGEFIAGPDVNE